MPLAPKRYFRCRLKKWFEENCRHLPWRRTTNPYRVLVAEILLQQTDAAKVAAIYPDFLRDFSSATRLASARKSQVAKYISKIGLNYRTERLIGVARSVCERFGGVVPSSEVDLLSLPGVGKYIARAILCNAFGRRVAIVDTNVIRLLDRYFGVKSQRPRPRTDPQIWDVAQVLLPRRTSDCRAWNFTLLDFTATVCTFYNPQCGGCSVSFHCNDLLSRRR